MTKKAALTIKGREVEPAAEDVLDEALDAAAQYEDGHVIFCRGGFLCQADPATHECPWCYRISPDDERETEDILMEAMRPVRH